jgi:hypothetical protein
MPSPPAPAVAAVEESESFVSPLWDALCQRADVEQTEATEDALAASAPGVPSLARLVEETEPPDASEGATAAPATGTYTPAEPAHTTAGTWGICVLV